MNELNLILFTTNGEILYALQLSSTAIFKSQFKF